MPVRAPGGAGARICWSPRERGAARETVGGLPSQVGVSCLEDQSRKTGMMLSDGKDLS